MSIDRKHLTLPLRATLLLAATIALSTTSALAADITVRASFSKSVVTLGEEFDYIITFSSRTGRLSRDTPGLPTQPKFTNLQVRSTYSAHSLRGGFYNKLTVRLRATGVGTGLATGGRTKYGGTNYTVPVARIRIVKSMLETLPAALRSGGILHPVTNDAQINRQIQGRFFAKMNLSKTAPYLKETIVADCVLYFDANLSPSLPRPVWQAPKEWKGFLASEEVVTKPVVQYEVIGGRRFSKAIIARYFLTPVKTGKIAIPRSSANSELQVQMENSSSSGFNSIFSFSSRKVRIPLPLPGATINVKPLPTTGRPPSFLGAVGQFAFLAKVDRTKMTQDDLLTLRCEVIGNGFLGSIARPKIPDMLNWKQLGDPQEKVETPKGAGTSRGKKSFEFVFRPQKPGTLTIPAIAYAFFNPSQGRYVEQVHGPFTIQVAKGEERQLLLAQGSAPTASSPASSSRSAVIGERMAFIHTAVPSAAYAARPFYATGLFIPLQFLPFLLLALAGGARASGDYRRRNAQRLRFRSAGGQARRELRLARTNLKNNDLDAFFIHLPEALRGYLATKLGRTSSGLTFEEMEEACLDCGLAQETIGELRSILERCDGARYSSVGGSQEAAEKALDEATRLLNDIDTAFGKEK